MLLRAPLKIPFSTVSTQSGHRADRIPAVCYAVIAAIGATHDRCVGARAFHGVRHGMGDPVAPYPWIFSFGSGAGGLLPPGDEPGAAGRPAPRHCPPACSRPRVLIVFPPG